MRGFHFGRVTPESEGVRRYGEYALHIQCPWRIEGPDGIVTGRADLWEPADQAKPVDIRMWDYDCDGNLQDNRIAILLGCQVKNERRVENETDSLVVESVDADDFGGAVISLSGGFRLVLFSDGSVSEDWRLFEPS